ncbi:hypothetical protein HYQ46_005437 [Verticillium longisporum]|nr:hypothetical protein HYQ46_005437 [Verticillium longisporum]
MLSVVSRSKADGDARRPWAYCGASTSRKTVELLNHGRRKVALLASQRWKPATLKTPKELATNAENPLQTPTLETVTGPLGSSDKTD